MNSVCDDFFLNVFLNITLYSQTPGCSTTILLKRTTAKNYHTVEKTMMPVLIRLTVDNREAFCGIFKIEVATAYGKQKVE